MITNINEKMTRDKFGKYYIYQVDIVGSIEEFKALPLQSKIMVCLKEWSGDIFTYINGRKVFIKRRTI